MLSLPGKESPSDEGLNSAAVINPHSARPFVSTAAGSNIDKTQSQLLGNLQQTQDTLPLTERKAEGLLGQSRFNNNRNSDITCDQSSSAVQITTGKRDIASEATTSKNIKHWRQNLQELTRRVGQTRRQSQDEKFRSPTLHES